MSGISEQRRTLQKDLAKVFLVKVLTVVLKSCNYDNKAVTEGFAILSKKGQ